MKPNSIEKLKQAENFMNAAAGLLDSVVSVEWESLAEGDYKTEECIDEMESISNALRKQRASVMKLVMDQSFRQVAEERPSTMRFLEAKHLNSIPKRRITVSDEQTRDNGRIDGYSYGAGRTFD